MRAGPGGFPGALRGPARVGRDAAAAGCPVRRQLSARSLQRLADNIAKWDNPRMRRVRNPDYKPFVMEGAAEALRAEPR